MDVATTEAFVKAELQRLGPDGSHDWWHIHRVRCLALSLAKEEGLQVMVPQRSSQRGHVVIEIE